MTIVFASTTVHITRPYVKTAYTCRSMHAFNINNFNYLHSRAYALMLKKKKKKKKSLNSTTVLRASALRAGA